MIGPDLRITDGRCHCFVAYSCTRAGTGSPFRIKRWSMNDSSASAIDQVAKSASPRSGMRRSATSISFCAEAAPRSLSGLSART